MAGTFDEVAALVAVVERGTFAAAAAHLGVSASQVTKRIQALEARLATQLVRRTTRRCALTDAGQRFYDGVRGIPAQLHAAEEKAREAGGPVHGRLRVIMPSYFASSGFHHELIPAYLAKHPAVHLSLTIVADPVEHLGEDFDLLVAGRAPHQRFPDTARVHRRLLEFRGAVFATPGYLARCGTPRHPRDLLAHNCLSYPNREWHFTEPGTGASVVVPTRGTLTTNSNAVLYAAVMRDIGLAYSFPYFFDRELAEGRVVSVLDRFTRGAHTDIHLFYPAGRYVPRRTRAFVDALAAHFRR